MLLEAYRAIKTELENKTTGIKLIDWFNDQYNGTIHTVPAVFVEFPKPLQFETLKGQCLFFQKLLGFGNLTTRMIFFYIILMRPTKCVVSINMV